MGILKKKDDVGGTSASKPPRKLTQLQVVIAKGGMMDVSNVNPAADCLNLGSQIGISLSSGCQWYQSWRGAGVVLKSGHVTTSADR